MPVSRLPIFTYLTHFLTLAYLTVGLNALFRPRSALSLFGFKYPASSQSKDAQRIIAGLLQIYGARDIFMAVALYVCTYLHLLPITGILFLAGAGVAFVDGLVHKRSPGVGFWTFHWNGTLIQLVLGVVLVGTFDWVILPAKWMG